MADRQAISSQEYRTAHGIGRRTASQNICYKESSNLIAKISTTPQRGAGGVQKNDQPRASRKRAATKQPYRKRRKQLDGNGEDLMVHVHPPMVQLNTHQSQHELMMSLHNSRQTTLGIPQAQHSVYKPAGRHVEADCKVATTSQMGRIGGKSCTSNVTPTILPLTTVNLKLHEKREASRHWRTIMPDRRDRAHNDNNAAYTSSRDDDAKVKDYVERWIQDLSWFPDDVPMPMGDHHQPCPMIPPPSTSSVSAAAAEAVIPPAHVINPMMGTINNTLHSIRASYLNPAFMG